jgi:beta-galactosidase
MYSRRSFLKTGATVAASSLFPSSALRASIATLGSNANQAGETEHARRLSDGWEYLQGPMGGPWQVWHSEEVAVWQQVAMPHCFNAYDGCDPDVPYYRGNGWYRTHVPIANPFQKGRTLLHFEGAGQTTALYVGEKLAGKHTGGYDEFVFDITDLLPQSPQAAIPPTENTPSTAAKNKTKKPEGVPISVLCDNSRDLSRMPSDLSDFSLYGGVYRHVNLVYVSRSVSRNPARANRVPLSKKSSADRNHRNVVQPRKCNRIVKNFHRSGRCEWHLSPPHNPRAEALARRNGNNQLYCHDPSAMEPSRSASL